MNRRNFISTLVGGIAAGAAVRSWPFRVYSFPSEVSAPKIFEWETVSEFLTGTSPALYGECVALQLEKIRDKIPVLYEREKVFLDAIENRDNWLGVSQRKFRLPLNVNQPSAILTQ